MFLPSEGRSLCGGRWGWDRDFAFYTVSLWFPQCACLECTSWSSLVGRIAPYLPVPWSHFLNNLSDRNAERRWQRRTSEIRTEEERGDKTRPQCLWRCCLLRRFLFSDTCVLKQKLGFVVGLCKSHLRQVFQCLYNLIESREVLELIQWQIQKMG